MGNGVSLGVSHIRINQIGRRVGFTIESHYVRQFDEGITTRLDEADGRLEARARTLNFHLVEVQSGWDFQ